MTRLEQIPSASHSMGVEAQFGMWSSPAPFPVSGNNSTAPDSLKPSVVFGDPHAMYKFLENRLKQSSPGSFGVPWEGPSLSSKDRLEQPVPGSLGFPLEGPSPSSDILSLEKLLQRDPPELADALGDLNQARQESQEEDFPLPSDAAIANARRLLREMYDILPRRFEVYPTQDGEIAIDAPAGHGRSVILLCDSDGGALCLVNNDGDQCRARYSNANKLPDGFLREALNELKPRDDQAA